MIFAIREKHPGHEAHLRWLADEVRCPSVAQQIVFQEYVNTVTESQHRLQRLNEQIEVFVKQWRLYPVVEALDEYARCKNDRRGDGRIGAG